MLTIQRKPKGFLSRIISNLFVTAFADGEENPPATTDPTPTPAATPPATPPADPKPSGTVNFEELITKARNEEKDKLYPQIEKLKTKNNDLLLVIGERDKTIADQQAQLLKATQDLEKAVQAKGEAGTAPAEATARITTLESSIETMKVNHEAEVAALKLELYKQQKFSEVGTSNFLPELVSGKTEAEIDASIEASKARLAGIQQSLMKGVQLPSANVSVSSMAKDLEKSPQEIARMTAPEYAAYRAELAKAGLVK